MGYYCELEEINTTDEETETETESDSEYEYITGKAEHCYC